MPLSTEQRAGIEAALAAYREYYPDGRYPADVERHVRQLEAQLAEHEARKERRNERRVTRAAILEGSSDEPAAPC